VFLPPAETIAGCAFPVPAGWWRYSPGWRSCRIKQINKTQSHKNAHKAQNKAFSCDLCITIRENFVFLRKCFGSSRALFFYKETRKPGIQELSKAFRGFLASLWNCCWLRLGRVAHKQSAFYLKDILI